jgi:Kef-type K+ transport system membrane component KefB
MSTTALLLQLIVILVTARACGWLLKYLGQPSVVGGLSVIVPLVLGLAISPTIYPSLAPEGVGFWPFALFMSSALSITAFTVIALAAFVYLVLKPAFAWLLRTYAPDGEPTTAVMTSLMIGLLVCAMLTEWLHLHAVVGKIAGGAVGARMSGYGWRDSLATGSLMNARGLMELIVIVTTAMTGPLVALFVGKPSTRASAAEPGTLAKS